MGKTKKGTSARVARRRKQIKESAAQQLCMDNISTGLNESNDSFKSDSSEFFRTVLFFHLDFFCPPQTIARASSAWRTFASLLIDVFSFLLRCFRLFELVHVLNLVYVYL